MQRNSKSVERTLLVSALSIVLCCVALFGNAYAWMMESMSHNVATIQAGTLQVDLVDAAEDGKSFIIKAGTDQAESNVPLVFTKVAIDDGTQVAESGGQAVAEESITVWDLGETYQIPTMYVVNQGTTDLKYTISIEGITKINLNESTTVNLADLIDFSIQINNEPIKGTSAVGTLQISDNLDTTDIDESKPDKVVILGKLKDNVDLDSYQGIEFTGITIKIDAEQTGQ